MFPLVSLLSRFSRNFIVFLPCVTIILCVCLLTQYLCSESDSLSVIITLLGWTLLTNVSIFSQLACIFPGVLSARLSVPDWLTGPECSRQDLTLAVTERSGQSLLHGAGGTKAENCENCERRQYCNGRLMARHIHVWVLFSVCVWF